MGFIYFLIITPIGILMRLLGEFTQNLSTTKIKSIGLKEKYKYNEKAILNDKFLKEFLLFLKERKKYWLLPIIIVLALFGALIVLSQGSVVTVIYTIF